jgi:hypothetical protein
MYVYVCACAYVGEKEKNGRERESEINKLREVAERKKREERGISGRDIKPG